MAEFSLSFEEFRYLPFDTKERYHRALLLGCSISEYTGYAAGTISQAEMKAILVWRKQHPHSVSLVVHIMKAPLPIKLDMLKLFDNLCIPCSSIEPDLVKAHIEFGAFKGIDYYAEEGWRNCPKSLFMWAWMYGHTFEAISLDTVVENKNEFIVPANHLATLGLWYTDQTISNSVYVSSLINSRSAAFDDRLAILLREGTKRGVWYGLKKTWCLRHYVLAPSTVIDDKTTAYTKLGPRLLTNIQLQQQLVYPLFNRLKFKQYHKSVRQTLMTVCCMAKHQYANFKVPKDIVTKVLEYVHWNCYQHQGSMLRSYQRLIYFYSDSRNLLSDYYYWLVPAKTKSRHFAVAKIRAGFTYERYDRDFRIKSLIESIALWKLALTADAAEVLATLMVDNKIHAHYVKEKEIQVADDGTIIDLPWALRLSKFRRYERERILKNIFKDLNEPAAKKQAI